MVMTSHLMTLSTFRAARHQTNLSMGQLVSVMLGVSPTASWRLLNEPLWDEARSKKGDDDIFTSECQKKSHGHIGRIMIGQTARCLRR